MKKTEHALEPARIRRGAAILLLPAILLLCGCVIRSVNPWLPADTKVKDPSLAGVWHDDAENETVFFASAGETNYNITLVNDRNAEQSRFTGSLHAIQDKLLLVVGPSDQIGMENVTIVPGHLLLKVELTNDVMALTMPDIDSFGDRIAGKNLKLLDGGSKDSGYLFFSPTEDMFAFLKSQLADPAFFDEKPIYTFRRVSSVVRE